VSDRIGEGVPPGLYGQVRTHAENELQFLAQLEHLLDKGVFTATYKYALLLALVDLAIERSQQPQGDTTPPIFSLEDIAEKFIALYWRQTLPYPSSRDAPVVLHQNKGRQVVIARLIAEAHGRYSSIHALRQDRRAWQRLLSQVGRLIRQMPLWKLQVIDGEERRFLYTEASGSNGIQLLPGVAEHLNRLGPLIRRLVQGEWLRFIQELAENRQVLHHSSQLPSFLFGADRQSLLKLRPGLEQLQQGRCFYCSGRLRTTVAVDHFVPWSRYPRDYTHNFVLAHTSCNGNKADFLASENHLASWLERNQGFASELDEISSETGFAADAAGSINVARWAYGLAQEAEALVWCHGREFRRLTGAWKGLLGQGGQ
jgi:hypothetical protein